MVDRVKVDRECPRCHVRAYHLGNDGGIPHRISCVSCGHVWTGRIRNDEQRDKVRDGWEPPLGVDAPDESGPLREGWHIMIGPGHSGFGAYAVMDEYPDEGSVCLATFDPKDCPDAAVGVEAALRTAGAAGPLGDPDVLALPSKCEFPVCAVHHICTRNCERNAGVKEGGNG